MSLLWVLSIFSKFQDFWSFKKLPYVEISFQHNAGLWLRLRYESWWKWTPPPTYSPELPTAPNFWNLVELTIYFSHLQNSCRPAIFNLANWSMLNSVLVSFVNYQAYLWKSLHKVSSNVSFFYKNENTL